MKNRLVSIACCFVALFMSYSCKRASKIQEEIEKQLVAVVSIGKIVNLDYDKLAIKLSVNGTTQEFSSNSQLANNILYPAQTVTVGATLSKGGKLVAQNIDGDARCPYVTRTLSPGVNHVSLTFCLEKQEGEGEGDDDDDGKDVSDPTENDDDVKDPNKRTDLEINPKVDK